MEEPSPPLWLQTLAVAWTGIPPEDLNLTADFDPLQLVWHFPFPCGEEDGCSTAPPSPADYPLQQTNSTFNYENFSRLDNLFAVLGVNTLLLCCTMLIVLQCKRYPILKRLYEVRLHAKEYEDLHARPTGEVSFYPADSRTGLWSPPLDDMQRLIGLDGVVLLRFTTMCFNFSLAYLPIAFLLVLHYAFGPGEQEGLSAWQISNQGESLSLWIPICAAYYLAFVLMAFLKHEYKRLCEMRSFYLAGRQSSGASDDPFESEGTFARSVSGSTQTTQDASEHAATDAAPVDQALWEAVRCTVKVEDIPVGLQTTSSLQDKFEGMFGERSVEHAVLSVDVTDLRHAIKAHRMHLRRLYPQPTPKRRRRFGRSSFVIDYCPPRLLKCGSACRQELIELQGTLWKSWSNFYAQILRTLNITEPTLQEREEKIRELYMKIHERQKSGSRVWQDDSDTYSRIDQLEATMRKSSKTILRNASNHLCPRVRSVRRVLMQVYTAVLNDVRSIYRMAKNSVDETTGFVTFRTASAHAMATQMLLQKSPATIVATRAPFPKDIIWRNIIVPDKVVNTRCACSFPLIIIIILMWSVISSAIQALTDWKFIVYVCKAFFPHIYNLIAGTVEDIPGTRLLAALLVGYLPVLAWLLFISVTPHFFRMWFVKIERHKQWSKIVRLSFDRYFLVQIVSFYVTVFAGSFIDTNPDPLKLTQGVLTKTVTKMDSVSGYFTCLILTKLGLRGANYMLRPGPCIEWMMRYWGEVSRQEEPSNTGHTIPTEEAFLENQSNGYGEKTYKGSLGGWQAEKLLAEGPFFERVFTDVALSLALCMMYGIMSPVVIFAGVAYFGVVATLMRYNLLFVYIQDHDSGGEIFFSLFNKSVMSLLASLLLLQSYLMAAGTHPFEIGNAKSFVLHGALPALMIIVIGLWNWIHSRYQPFCATLSLDEAKRKDLEFSVRRKNGMMGFFQWSSSPAETKYSGNTCMQDIFEDPAIKEAKRILEGNGSLDRRELAWQELEGDFSTRWWR